MTLEEIRQLPDVTAATAAAPHMGWPEKGITVWGSDRAAIVCHYNPDDVRKAWFSSWNYKQFHYIAEAEWPDWVRLAKAILAVNEKLG